VSSHEEHSPEYISAAGAELQKLAARIAKSGLHQKIEIVLIYLPLCSKQDLVKAFDEKLKGITA
jgi:hypothetical protein